MMKVIPETRHVHYIRYIRFYILRKMLHAWTHLHLKTIKFMLRLLCRLTDGAAITMILS